MQNPELLKFKCVTFAQAIPLSLMLLTICSTLKIFKNWVGKLGLREVGQEHPSPSVDFL